ncbi:glucokinase [Pseudomonas sp. CCI3.2]|uniref:glucokinase n=1 Tax=unclassified Pseudomonas TaxID=196821 RepID=UPI002AC98DEE|nr:MULTISPECIES: glucokinase [unclassified Pseudomonas]MEB0077576.1 glucokinase [Pseudomonas sp. MH10out]MEB0089680.1 glucokinase [Pseudomonas sp. CCI4.2]MEB0104213.1 glucokinase [Pseudomonas sp. CCI3.2]MEB0128969.1 glucokinase [Pseudomonas sp. CCI2.4]MEB0157705.1 glucokinase [Pseudomonas sp. AH2 (2023)]
MKLALVGDIGGTNARFAIWEDDTLHSVRVFPTIDYASPEKALEVYLEDLDLHPGEVGSVCLAVAGPVGGDEFHFTNSHWRISRSEFCAHLKVDNLLMVNDFTAMALGMTRLKDDEYLTVCHGIPEEGRPRVVIGPGTGLGVGTLIGLADNHWLALPGEGGHVDLPLGTPREAQIWARLMTEHEHVSAETILSGAGLLLLYKTSCSLDNLEPTLKSPAAITSAAVAGDPIAAAVLEQFCCWLGRVAGNNVLTVGGRGGVYICGGVIPRFSDFFMASGFARSFAEKGLMKDYFKGVPVWLVTAEYPGLMGAGVALQQAFGQV